VCCTSCRRSTSLSLVLALRAALIGGPLVTAWPCLPARLPACPCLADYLSDKDWVCAFEKPKGNPAAFVRPATTVLR
jgi:hypothetical protein